MEREKSILFTGKLKLTSLPLFYFLEQNQFILENIIDVERTYNFPIEVEVSFDCLTMFFDLQSLFMLFFFFFNAGPT